MAKTYGVICTKGGVGKTTTTANLGGILADMGHILADMSQKTLLIDCDPQQLLSQLFPLAINHQGKKLLNLDKWLSRLHNDITPPDTLTALSFRLTTTIHDLPIGF